VSRTMRFRVWDRSCRMMLYSEGACALHGNCVQSPRKDNGELTPMRSTPEVHVTGPLSRLYATRRRPKRLTP